MRLKRVMDKVKKSIAPTPEDKKRDKWRNKLENARIAYASTLKEIAKFQGIYEGTREVNGNPNTNVSPGWGNSTVVPGPPYASYVESAAAASAPTTTGG